MFHQKDSGQIRELWHDMILYETARIYRLPTYTFSRRLIISSVPYWNNHDESEYIITE